MTDTNLIDAFIQQVKRTPDLPAIEDGAMSLSYSNLLARVKDCAAGLALQGVRPGDHVAVLLPRSWQLIVTTLAILRSGAVVVPLDHQSPDNRLQHMLETADCVLVIAQPDMTFAATPVTTFDSLSGTTTVQDQPNCAVSRDDPAFVFFTSGSTGTPKAVVVPHRAVLRLGQDGYTPLGPGRRVVSLSNPSFDAINFDIWAPLLTGGVCVIIPPHIATDFHQIAKTLTHSQADTLFLTVALFNAIVAEVPTCFASLGTVLIGGERISTRTVMQWYDDNPDSGCVIHNVYGPTECATFSLCCPIRRDEIRADAPIGRPLPGTQIHIDKDSGELWIGGDAVGLGYYKQPDITSAAFVLQDGQIYYRTGDIVTLNDDDTVHFVGRIGRQAKIRGFRVEPGEVETLLESHSAVSQAFVHVQSNDDAPSQLHGYIILNAPVDYPTFRRFMQRVLPAYMIPHLLFQVSAFPMTANGKVNAGALTSMDAPVWKPTATDTPSDPTQAALLELAQVILERGDLTQNDTFLTGGGDSLRALVFKHRLEQEQGLVVTLQHILSCPFHDLAARARPCDTGLTFTSFADHKMAPATSEQKRLWLDAQHHPQSCAYSVPLIYDLSGPVDAQRLGNAVAATFAAHPVFATAFVDADGTLWQVQRPQTDCRFHAFQPGQVTAKTCAARTQAFFDQPFDLGSAALCQVYWMPFDDVTGRLVIHAHHIVFDGWALNLFLREISQRYDNPNFVPDPPTMDMAGFANRQTHATEQDDQKEQRQTLCELWDDRALPEPPLLPLRDANRPVAHIVSQQLTAAQLAPLQLLSQSRGVTPFQLLMMVCGWAFSAVTGRQNFNIASPTSNRQLPDSSKTIGMMANTLLFPVTLDAHQTGSAVLDLHQTIWSDVMNCADVPLEHLHDKSRISDTHRKLQFDCMFVMENTTYDSLILPNVDASFSHPYRVAPKAPIVVFVTPTEHGASLHAEIDERYFSTQDATRFLAVFTAGLGQLGGPDHCIGEITGPTHAALYGPERKLQSKTIAGLLQAQAAKTPDAFALRSGDDTLTYAQMMARANAMSHWVSAQIPVDKHPVVAVFMEPGVDYVIAIVALAQINATILPLDPSFPTVILENIVTLGQPTIIVGDETSRGCDIADQPVIPLPILEEAAEFTPRFDGNPLYLLFTSGSTGTPKGVKVWDDTLCNLLQWQSEFDGLHHPARTQQFSKLSFDVSFQEILTTLTTGGTLTLLPPDLRQDAEGLLTLMRSTGCERIFLPFVALKLLAETALTRQVVLPDLKQVISAGEALLCTQTLRDWFKTMPNARLINHYGPTETHVISSYHLADDPDDWPDIAPIGHPISNCRFRIAQPDGELRAAGPFIRKCYLDPSHNDARFINDGGLHYLTGDRVSLLRNDRLACLGRLDDQIKISGHRIERQEIETVLNRHPNVALSMVDLSADGQLMAFVEPKGPLPTTTILNAHLAHDLPQHVRIKQLLQVDEWPRTASGKINRKALVPPTIPKPEPFETGEEDQPVKALCRIFEDIVGPAIIPTQTFWAAGANSLDLMRYRNEVQRALSCQISVADLFGKGTTPIRLAEMLTAGSSNVTAADTPVVPVLQNRTEKIAIIGLAADLPGAGDIAKFSRMILQSQDGIDMFTAPLGAIGARSQMTAPLGFDPSYFGISRQEAILMDPQQRHLMMNAVQALSDAGLDPARSPRSIGVIASCGENTYYQDMLRSADPDSIPDPFQMALHHDKDFAATKLAFRLGLTGPAMTVQAACGSSLIGVHTAAGMLRNGDCDVMLVGASLVDPTLSNGYTYRPNHIFSKDGTCRPFDKDASGTVGASGVCFVVLTPLSRAVADEHRIYGTLEGSALNNDGQDKMTYTAPSATGQKAALLRALHAAGLKGSDIGYIEAHGTGTPLGDPIEIDAIDQVYGQRNDRLMVSSLKSQIGHLGAAAGLAGMIRATLAIRHQVFPPNLHFKSANPELHLESRNIDVPTTTQPWIAPKRRAGISSFGIGGTNAHAIISQYDRASAPASAVTPQTLFISAHTSDSLRRWANQIADFLENHPDRAADVVRFLQFGTPERAFRAAFVWQNVLHAVQSLREITGQAIKSNPNRTVAADMTPQEQCDDWMAGATLPSDGLAAPAPFGFPTYPFQIDTYVFARTSAPSAPAPAAARLDPAEWFLQPLWAPLGQPHAPQGTPDRIAIVLNDTPEHLPKLLGYERVITIEVAQARGNAAPDQFKTTLAPQDFAEIAQQIAAQGLPQNVDLINMLPLAIGPDTEIATRAVAQIACLDVMPGLVALAQGLNATNTRMIHLSQGGASAATGQVTHPFANLLCGACEVLPGETGLPNYWLDIQPGALNQLSNCLHAPSLPSGRTAFAHGQLWHRTRARLPQTTRNPTIPRRAVVIGGTGGIGRNICEALLSAGTNRIDILARNPVLPESLAEYKDQITLHKVDLGADTVVWPRFDGPVDDIIFAAGVGSYGIVTHRDAQEMQMRNRVKIAGTAQLETLVTQVQPSRVFYCSSMAAEMGGKGQLDYSATNGLLDGMAHWTNSQAPHTQRMSLNWDIWSQSGMAVNAMIHDAQHRDHLSFGLSDAEGRATFLRALQHTCPQLLVSTLPLATARRFYEPAPKSQMQQGAVTDLTQIMTVVSEWLSLDEVDTDSPMEDLGIDSILMIDLLELLQDRFGYAPELSAIPPNATLAELAALMEPATTEETPIATLCALFAQTLSLPQVSADETLATLCVDSLHAIDLIEQIQTTFGATLSVSDFDEDQTVLMILARIIDAPTATLALPQVIVDQWRVGTSDRAICFIHPVGGETACYKPLLDKVDPAVSIFAIADPKLRAMDPVTQPIAAQAATYRAALNGHLEFGPDQIELLGWSYGGWLVQEMAVQAETAGSPFRHIAMIDPPDPDSGRRIGDINHEKIQDAFLFELTPRLITQGASDQPLATQIAPELQNQLDRLVTCCALNMDAMKTHRPAILQMTPASVFVADTAAKGLLVETANAKEQLDRWQTILKTPRYCLSLAADHYSILRPPALDTISKHLFIQIP